MPVIHMMLPVFVQVFLTFAVLIYLGPARRRSLAESRTHVDKPEVALGRFAWSDKATQVSNNYKNQFEIPVLFYAGVAFAMILKQTDVVMVTLAWAFVVTRVLHAIIHVGPNIVRYRGTAFILGALFLLIFWIVLAVRVIGAGGF